MLVFGAMARGTVEIEHLWMLSGVNVKLALTVCLPFPPRILKPKVLYIILLII